MCTDRTQIKDLCQLKCPKSGCHHCQSIRKGSFFQRSHYSIYQQMLIVSCFCEGMSVSTCHLDLGLSRERLTDYFDNLRGCYADDLEAIPIHFESLGPYEVDEFEIKHVETTSGGHANLWVQDIFERKTGLYWASIVPNRTGDVLISNIKDKIPSGSLIFSDDWASYRPLSSEGYRHYTVTHSKGEYARQEMIEQTLVHVHINTIEGLHRGLRQRVANKSRRNVERVKLILSEFMYRHSGRSLWSPFKYWWDK